MSPRKLGTAAALGALVLGVAGAPASLLPRIVNGKTTVERAAVGALLFGAVDQAYAICSGTMIGCQTFLTAAHCVESGAASRFHVYLQNGGIFPVSAISVHPGANFPIADVAVLTLGTPVTGIHPAHINQTSPTPFIPAPGTIVGFGVSSGSASDSGLKRIGKVTTASCPLETGTNDVASVCWIFADPLGAPGDDSNTCYGDSGGPIFLDLGAGPVVAGVTSGGTANDCLPTDHSYDANIATYQSFILGVGGADLDNTSCGAIPQVDDAGVTVIADDGTLGGGASTFTRHVVLTPSTQELRVTLNARDDATTDFNLYVKHGSPPTTTSFDCAGTGVTQFGACRFVAPAAGDWFVLVDRALGAGEFQLTTTVFGGSAPVCGNGAVELAEECDGADDAACPGQCTSACTCGTLDEFVCYKSGVTRGTPAVPKTPVTLADDVLSQSAALSGEQKLCVPSSLDGNPVDDPHTNLDGYAARGATPTSIDSRKMIRATSRFGSVALTRLRFDGLLVPTARDVKSFPAPPDPAHEVADDYACYKGRVAAGSSPVPRATNVGVVNDLETKIYKIRNAGRLCLPARLDGGGVKNPARALMCYAITHASGQSSHAGEHGLFLASALGTLRIDTQHEDELCVPASLVFGAADQCAAPSVIGAFPYTVEAGTDTATSDKTDPALSCGFGTHPGHTAWFRFTAPSNGTVVADTFGSDYDTILAAFTGACGAQSELACQDDVANGILQSRVGFPVTAGTTYSLEVGSYADTPGGTLDLHVNLTP